MLPYSGLAKMTTFSISCRPSLYSGLCEKLPSGRVNQGCQAGHEAYLAREPGELHLETEGVYTLEQISSVMIP